MKIRIEIVFKRIEIKIKIDIEIAIEKIEIEIRLSWI